MQRIGPVIVLFFLFSCMQVKEVSTVKDNSVPVSQFAAIDKKLSKLAKQVNGTVSHEGAKFFIRGAEVPKDKFQQRRIFWADSTIGRTIMIVPNFDRLGSDPLEWDFFTAAWIKNEPEGPYGMNVRTTYLIRRGTFDSIRNNIDQLLNRAVLELSKITAADIKQGS